MDRRIATHLRYIVFALISTIVLSACSKEEPVTLGFVGGLSGRVSDLGGPARNGMLLAIEEINARGGIRGQDVQSIIKDDKQDADTAIKVTQELLSQNVDAIIGPVTSSMAVKVAPLASRAETMMMGVTVTTNALSGKDDYFLRCLAPTAVHAGEVAEFLFRNMNINSFSAIYDLKNESYTLSWINDFKQRFTELGGKSQSILSFSSGKQDVLLPIVDEIVKDQSDAIIFVTNAVDAALLAKLIRNKDEEVILATSEWAGTERLIELGGRYVEGAIVPQYLDRESTEPDYVEFRDAYRQRFSQEPGFPGLIAYNATRVVLAKLETRPDGVSLKEAILNQKNFPGIQGDIKFDKFGDVISKTYITRIEDGRFKVQAR